MEPDDRGLDQVHQQPTGVGGHLIGEFRAGRLTRRDFLRRGAVAGLSLPVLGAALAACGSTGSTSTAPARPKRGGTLKAGLTGGGSSDTLDADNGLVDLDFARVIQLYDPLVNISLSGGLALQLAESVEPNADATEWTIRLRPDVTFHNGKSLTAEDVIFTFQRILDPKLPLAAASSLAAIDIANAQALDSLTLRLPCRTPFSTLLQNLADYDVYIVPVGYDPRQPVGTGAFVYKSFTPGVQSVFTRNPNYWRPGEPYIDELIISDYVDPAAQLNALLSNEVDYIDQLSFSTLHSAASGGAVIVTSGGGAFNNIVMRCDQPPFNDNNVRLAMKYIVNRPQMRELIYGGHGFLGNDVPCITDPQYDHALPQREQDIDHAKWLLKRAGYDRLNLELVTAPLAGGIMPQAEIFTQQAAAANVHITISQISTTDFFGPQYLQRTFTQDNWLYGLYFCQVALSAVPTAPYNETHFNDPSYTALFNEALRTTDYAKQTELAHEMQLIEYENGGNIIPNFTPCFDAHASTLHGIEGSNIGLPSWAYCFKTCWFE
jgi:peptide/nickel transport system substrate-binding protein